MRAEAPVFLPKQSVVSSNTEDGHTVNKGEDASSSSSQKQKYDRKHRRIRRKKVKEKKKETACLVKTHSCNGDDANKDLIQKGTCNDNPENQGLLRKNRRKGRRRQKGKQAKKKIDSNERYSNWMLNTNDENAIISHIGKHRKNRRNRSSRNKAREIDHEENSKSDLKDEWFPSLTSSINTNQSTNVSSTQQSFWSKVANDGHEQSELMRIRDMKEQERIQHEIETFTRMDVLTFQTDGTETETAHETIDNGMNEKQANLPNTEGSVSGDVHCSVVGKLLNVDRLRRRWCIALENRRLEEEHKVIVENDEARAVMETTTSDDESSVDERNQSYEDEGLANCEESAIGDDMLPYEHTKFPLHYAIIADDEIAVEKLMRQPAEITRRDERVSIDDLHIRGAHQFPVNISHLHTKVSIVHLAIILCRHAVLKKLLSYGNSLKYVTNTFALDVLDDRKRTPLMLACELSLDNIIQLLLSYGPKLLMKHAKTGDCVLHIACRHGQPSTVKLILGCDRGLTSSKDKNSARQRLLCCRNRKGETPLHIACSAGKFSVLDSLLSSASPSAIDKALLIHDNTGKTPLLTAISNEALTSVMHLMTRRVNKNNVDSLRHECPLSLAVTTKSMEMIYLLIECRHLSIFSTFDYSAALCKVICTFDDTSEEAYELIDLFIEEGADPHTITTFTLISSEDSESEPMLRMRPFTYAAMRGHVKCVARMLDAFKITKQHKMKLLREDPVLKNQPTSFFDVKDTLEMQKVTLSMEETLINLLRDVLKMEEDDYFSTRKLGSCLAIFRRGGDHLNKNTLVRILKAVKIGNTFAPREEVFEGHYMHFIAASQDQFEMHTSPYSTLPFVQTWSFSLSNMKWVWEELPTCYDVICPWMRDALPLKPVKDEKYLHDRDICYLIVEGKRLRAHKSILSKKSAKFEAAFRFADMRSADTEDSSYVTEVELDLSLRYVRLLIVHCYHGSLVTGLSSNRTEFVQDLLQLFFIAEEFLCASLALECEMRLLSATPYTCFCFNCCETAELIPPREIKCSFQTKVSSTIKLCPFVNNEW